MTLRKKILLLPTLGMVAILGVFSFVSILAVQRSAQTALMERLTFTQQQASILDFILKEIREQTESRLRTAGPGLMASPENVKKGILEEWRKTMFIQPLYLSLLDRKGNVLVTVPETRSIAGTSKISYEHIREALAGGGTQTSNAYLDPYFQIPVAYLSFPIFDTSSDVPEGILEVTLDPMSADILPFISPASLGETAHAEVVDTSGIILSSTKRELLLTMSDHGDWLATQVKNKNSVVSTCHNCHEPSGPGGRSREVITFAPLKTAPWGLVVRQDESETLAPSRRLQQELGALGFLSLLVIASVAWVTTESVARPIRVLNKTSLRLATGDLDDPVPIVGSGEIATLATSFEAVRKKLKDSLEELDQRRQELETSEQLRSQLLRNLISNEEEKRKRIARDLHDETSQAIASLLVGLQTIAESPPMEPDALAVKLNALQLTARKTLEEVHRVIYELRPSIIDDLGLVPAIKWYAEGRLENAGIKLYLETGGQEQRLGQEIEMSIYRIVQEAVTNMIKYSGAEICSILIDFQERAVAVHIEDDGRGFEPQEVLSSTSGQLHFGILGIKERVELLNGALQVNSQPGKGTEIDISIPYGKEGTAR